MAYQSPIINQVPPNKRTNLGQTGIRPGLGERTTAPNARESSWDSIAHIKNPFGAFADSKDFGYWFNYFWSEAVMTPGLTPAQKVKISESFFSVFRETPAPPGYAVRPDFAGRDNAFKENVLRQLLIIGFQRVAIDPPQRAEFINTKALTGFGRPPAPMPQVVTDASELNLAPIKADGKDWIIAFRCDSRAYEELCSHGGFNSRARTAADALRNSYALNEQWHPYSNPVYKNSLFLRRGATNRDNCLHTVISVGSEFHMTVHFPKLDDALNFDARSPNDKRFLLAKPFDEWTKADIQTAAAHRQKVGAVMNYSAGMVDHLEKVNHVHVLYLNGLKGVNTEAVISGEDSFPERGMVNVPPSHLLADIQFVQKYWYNPGFGEIKLYEVAFAPIRWVPSEPVINALLGSGAKAQILQQIESEIRKSHLRPEIHDEGLEFAAYKLNAPLRLTREERIDLLKLLKAYIATNPKSLGRAQKAHLIEKRRRLEKKINALSPLEWSGFQKQAKTA